ncbi:MAG: hypothetical protein P4L03_10350 [Terracidiphilus sp.]|nr:hypothetical protein [Terracidiphilus sp.]
MRLGKIYVVVFALVCLLAAAPAHAQFGKLKSMVQDKVGAGNNNPQSVKQPKGAVGEAQATYAPGVKKSVNVSRQSGGTPEASMATATSGRSQTITVKLSHIDARQFDAVQSASPCNKLSNFQILSATQVKVTIDLTGAKPGSCSLYFRSGGRTVYSSNVAVR